MNHSLPILALLVCSATLVETSAQEGVFGRHHGGLMDPLLAMASESVAGTKPVIPPRPIPSQLTKRASSGPTRIPAQIIDPEELPSSNDTEMGGSGLGDSELLDPESVPDRRKSSQRSRPRPRGESLDSFEDDRCLPWATESKGSEFALPGFRPRSSNRNQPSRSRSDRPCPTPPSDELIDPLDTPLKSLDFESGDFDRAFGASTLPGCPLPNAHPPGSTPPPILIPSVNPKSAPIDVRLSRRVTDPSVTELNGLGGVERQGLGMSGATSSVVAPVFDLERSWRMAEGHLDPLRAIDERTLALSLDPSEFRFVQKDLLPLSKELPRTAPDDGVWRRDVGLSVAPSRGAGKGPAATEGEPASAEKRDTEVKRPKLGWRLF